MVARHGMIGNRRAGRRLAFSASLLAMPSAQAAEIETTGEDIVVTAQKREERLVDVPIAVSVVSGADLERANLTRFDELARVIPNLQFEPGQTPNENSFSLRGISAASVGQGLQSSVGVYVDGLYVAGRSALNFDLFDVARIEVLRGPQGTLFGRNATAGALSIVSARPGHDWSGSVSASYGAFNDRRLGARVGGEIGSSGLFVQAAGSYTKRDGYILNTFDNRRLQSGESIGGRLSIGYRPAGSVIEIDLTGDYSREDNLSGVLSATPYTREVNVNTLPYNNRDIYGASATVRADLGAVAVTSITGFRGFTAVRQADNDATPLNLQFAVNRDKVGSFSQELRAESQGAGPFKWLAGVYYYGEVNRLNASVSLTFPSPPPSPPTLFNGVTSSRIFEQSIAGFGQASLTFGAGWELTLGGRYSSDRQRADVARTGAIPPLGFFAGNSVFRAESDDFSYKAALRYAIGPDQSVYATVSKGYKSGGVNVTTLSPANQDKQAYKPERAVNFEVGYKALLADGKLRLGLAGFLIDYRDIQVFLADPLTFDSFVGNADKARSYGLEAEVQARVTKALSLTASAGWTHATYSRFSGCSAAPPTDCDGNRLNRAPAATASLRADYTQPVGRFALRFSPDASYTGPTYFDPVNQPESRRAGYVLVNGEIALEAPDLGWSIAVYGKNLTDRDYFTDTINSPLPTGGTQWRYGAGVPRTYGVRLRGRF